jgi:hypothetical protein
MIAMLAWLVCLTAAFPLWRAWRANRRTSLLQALNWAIGSWAAWVIALGISAREQPATGAAARYIALSLTGCAGVAVLGARRPGVGAWNFVVVGLLAVLLLPLAESLFARGELQVGGFRAVFLGATLAVGVLNYLPTRLAPGAVLLGLGSALEVATLSGAPTLPDPASVGLALGLAPWAAHGAIRRRPRALSEFDRLWLDFRDRFGLVWGQRLREQFNRSAAHAGWPVVLRWQGLRLVAGATLPEPAVQAVLVETLRALRKRFGPEPNGKPGA